MEEMKEKKAIGLKAGEKFKQGYNCAEAILWVFRDELNLDLSDEAIKIATGFGGGLGQAGCLCGALASSIMTISMLQGRNNPHDNREPAYNNAKEFHQIFKESFGATCCRAIKTKPDGPEQRKDCLKLTATTADLLMKLIQEKGLAKK